MKSFKPALAPRSHLKYLVSVDETGSKTYIREDGRGQGPIRMWFGEIPKVNPISLMTSSLKSYP